MWRLALIVTAQLALSGPAGGGPFVVGDCAFQPQAGGPDMCAPTLFSAPALIQDGDEEDRKVTSTGACGGSYKADDGATNICCDQNERPECYSDGDCRCSYDPYCQSLCQPSGTCQQHDC